VSWHLLIIEDDPDIADALAEVFSARGYHVQVVSDGRQALDFVRRTGIRPDAILLDLLMPVMDGVEFLEARAAVPLLAIAPVIVITAQPEMGRGVPVYARLTKPLLLSELVDTVDRAVHGVPPGGSASRPARRAA
jgi:CheY-like chemotaxis protein